MTTIKINGRELENLVQWDVCVDFNFQTIGVRCKHETRTQDWLKTLFGNPVEIEITEGNFTSFFEAEAKELALEEPSFGGMMLIAKFHSIIRGGMHDHY